MMAPRKGLELYNQENGSSYVLSDPLGEGGQAYVWSALPKQGGQVIGGEVAVKFMKPLPKNTPADAYRKIWFAQAEEFSLSRLFNPSECFVSVYDFFHETRLNSFVTVMELIDGHDLFQVGTAYTQAMRQRNKPTGFPLPVALSLMMQVLKGFSHAEWFEQQGTLKDFVHRDLKPDNLMLTPRGQIKIIDLGLAKHAGRHEALETEGGLVRGTYCYLAPEQLHKQVELSFRTDLFALGIILYEWLTGKFFGDMSDDDNPSAPAERMKQPVHFMFLMAFHPRDLRYSKKNHTHITQPFRDYLARLLQPRPEDRFESVAQAYTTLQSILAEEGHELMSQEQLVAWYKEWSDEDSLPGFYNQPTEDIFIEDPAHTTLLQIQPYRNFDTPEEYVARKLEDGTVEAKAFRPSSPSPHPDTRGYASSGSGHPQPKRVLHPGGGSGDGHHFDVNAFSMDTPVPEESGELSHQMGGDHLPPSYSPSVKSQLNHQHAQRLAPPPSVYDPNLMQERLPPPPSIGHHYAPKVAIDDPVVEALAKTQSEKSPTNWLVIGLVVVLFAVVGVLAYVLIQQQKGTHKGTKVAMVDGGNGMGSSQQPSHRPKQKLPNDGRTSPDVKVQPVPVRRPEKRRIKPARRSKRVIRRKRWPRRRKRKVPQRAIPAVRQASPPKLVIEVKGNTCFLSGGGKSFGKKTRYEITQLPEGTHLFRCVNLGKNIYKRFNIKLKKGQTKTYPITLRMGWFVLRSAISYTVTLPGIGVLGKSGQRITLPEGQTSLILTRAGSEQQTISVIIRPNRTTTRTHR